MQPDEYGVLHMGVHALALLQAQAQCKIFDGEILQFSTEEFLELAEPHLKVSSLLFLQMHAFFDYVFYGHCVILYIEDLDGIAGWVTQVHAV